MRARKRWLATVGFLVMAGLVVAACGGGDGDERQATPSPAAERAATEPAEETASAEATTPAQAERESATEEAATSRGATQTPEATRAAETTATADADADPPEEGEADAEATATPAPEATATPETRATPEATPRATPTPDREPVENPAPEFPSGLTWFNVSEPLSFAKLRGKIVMLDFWTQGCINCQHIIPDLEQLEHEFPDSLVVIGVHTGKYTEEHEDSAVAEAIARFGLKHPVVNDPDRIIWRQWGARAWPTVVLIDPRGSVIGGQAGERVYAKFRDLVAQLHEDFTARGLIDTTPIPLALETRVASTFLSFPSEVLADEAGDRLFIADAGHHRIVVTDLDGRVITAYGSGLPGFADGGPAEARFRDPQGLELSPDGRTLWVADTRNHAIRAIDLKTDQVTTIAGTGQRGYQRFSSGSPLRTAMASPWDLHYRNGSLYIANAGTHQIWVLDPANDYLAVFAGTRREDIDDGHRLRTATLAQPSGITGDATHLYWVDAESSSVRRVPFAGTGNVETLIGTGLFRWGDADGPAGTAQIQHAQGLALGDGVVYLADTYNHKLRKLSLADFSVQTVAGSGERDWADGTGRAASFEEPGGLSIAGGTLYLADTGNHVIRVITPASGSVRTLVLTNLAAANPRLPIDGVLRVQLPTQVVAPGTSTLRITFISPKDFQLSRSAPSRLEIASSSERVARLGETVLTWQTDATEITLPVEITMREGEAEITGSGIVYFCRYDEQAICLIQQVQLVVPIQVSVGASGGDLRVEYLLPVVETTYGG